MSVKLPKTRLLLKAVTLVLAISLTLPPTAGFGAGDAATLEATKRDLAAVKKRLSEAKGRAHAIEVEVDKLNSQISSLSKQIRTQEADISSLESDIRSAEAQISELTLKYEKAAQASNARARQLYRTSTSESYMTIFFNSESLDEAARRQVFLEVLSTLDSKTMVRATRIRSDLAERKDDLRRITEDLGLQKKWLSQRRSLVEDARRERDAALESVNAEIAAHEKHVRELEAEAKRLTPIIRDSLSRSNGAISKSGFIWPINGRVTSGYGRRGGGFHSGIDIDGNTGDPIKASKAGTVASISCYGGYGICAVIDHGNGVSTLYAHMSRRAVSGGSVSQGQIIGYVGCTGSCSGSHLHFEVRVDGEPRNPREFLP